MESKYCEKIHEVYSIVCHRLDKGLLSKTLLLSDLNLAAAVLALLSLAMMVMGSICIGMSLSKGVPFFLKPASFCFILSGSTSNCCW